MRRLGCLTLGALLGAGGVLAALRVAAGSYSGGDQHG